ncbi:AraC family transcriptional regulator [Chitinophaga sedimenti]|uniref:helix-turn-helix domain-containing protein n=1 Tax=Chitinophaga sedimenti TaxID=2033606 RepID=UPI002002E8D0|nr:helix-turn-helix domain-containing protein [Chitinophaga sedimenti]MCK7553950.1 AraC family transcriptional regulator [Chitinophaga sedimenti]
MQNIAIGEKKEQRMLSKEKIAVCKADTDFYIKRLSGEALTNITSEVPYRHRGFCISILTSGDMEQYVDFDRQMVTGPAITMLEKGQIHQQIFGEGCELIHIYFTPEFLMTETQCLLNCWGCMFRSSVIRMDEDQLKEVLMYCRMLINEFRQDRPRKDAVLRSLLSALIISCGRIASPEPVHLKNEETQPQSMVLQFKMLVDKHFSDKVHVADYAEMLYITAGHLNDSVKAVFGRNAKNLIDEKRIMEAKRLLYLRNHSVKEIAYELSFEDDAYFNRFFKKHTGMTPVFFQKQIREKYN